MINVRRGCFETNSSSTHAIIIAKEEPDFIDYVVELNIGEFGWQFDVYNDIDEKASYLYTAACALRNYDVFDEIAEMLAPYGVPCFSSKRAEFYIDEDKKYKWLDNGYIDHNDECSEFVEYVLSDPEHLINYLFSDKSYIVTGNDNCDEIDRMWYAGKIHKADTYEHETFYKGN